MNQPIKTPIGKDFCQMTASELADHRERHKAGDPTAKIYTTTVLWRRHDGNKSVLSDLESPTEEHLVLKIRELRRKRIIISVSPTIERK